MFVNVAQKSNYSYIIKITYFSNKHPKASKETKSIIAARVNVLFLHILNVFLKAEEAFKFNII